MKKNWRILAALYLLLAGCADTINGKAIAEPEVARFHELLGKRDFKEIYQMASSELRNALPEAKTLALFEAIDRKLGPLEQTKEINWSVSTNNMVTTVVLVYASKFRDGEATETFTFRVRDKIPELLGYNISSLDMLIK